MTISTRPSPRLILRDLAAAFAFASMAVSGALPLWVVAVFASGLGLALLGKRILAERNLLAIAILGTSAVVLYSAVAGSSWDLVLAACTFAGIITLSRMLAAPTPSTDNQVHLTSLLMAAGGAALSAEIFFALCLVVFAVLSMLSLGLSTLESPVAPQSKLHRAAIRQLLVGATFAVLGAGVFFLAFPRLSWNLAARRNPPVSGVPSTGFSDRVQLGGDGRIKTSPRIVARVKLTPDPGIRQLDAYWIGQALDTFNGREWTARDQSSSRGSVAILRARRAHLLYQDVEILPAFGSRTLVAMETPTTFLNARANLSSGTTPTQLLRIGPDQVRFAEVSSGYTYRAISSPPLAGAAEAEPDQGSVSEAYLQLPNRLDPRVPALAERIAGGETDPLRVARSLENYLKGNYRYTLELQDATDPLADFLFHRRSGHCADFATALAILLRSQRIPARVAVGFYGGERIVDQYVLRAGDAHAWTQVWIRGKGFVSLDATPENHRAGQPGWFLDWVTRWYEVLERNWRTGIVDYSIRDQAQLAHQLIDRPTSISLKLPRLAAPAAGASMIAFLGVVIWLRRRRVKKTRLDAAALLGLRLERALRRAQLQRQGEDLEEATRRLLAEGHPFHRSLASISRRYLEVRFGGRGLREGEARQMARSLTQAIARTDA